MRTTTKARKITILPSTVTNLRILSKSSFKNTHLGVSSPASVADTLQNKKKKNKIDRTFPCNSFLWSRSKRRWYYLQVAIATSNPILRVPLLSLREVARSSSTARWKIRKPSSLCLLRKAISKYLNNHCLYIFGIKWCFNKINRLTIRPNSI